MRTPPDFREELHPEEIVRRHCPHPWLAGLAIAAIVWATGMLLRAIGPASGDPQPPPHVVASHGRDAKPISLARRADAAPAGPKDQ